MEFRLRDFEALHIVLMVGARIGQEDLSYALLNHGFADRVPQHVRGRLRHEDPQPRLFSDRFLFVEGKVREHGILKRLPEFLHDIDEGLARDQPFGQMEQIGHDGGADLRVIQEFRVVVAEELRIREVMGIAWVVENPAQCMPTGPAFQSRPHTLVAGGRQVLEEERETTQLY